MALHFDSSSGNKKPTFGGFFIARTGIEPATQRFSDPFGVKR
jgi:hypothetical protein